MTTEQLIEQILSSNPAISKEQIMERLNKEKRRTNGFILEETLLRIIAADFGIPVQSNNASTPTLSVRDLVPSLNHVSVVGRVVATFPSKAFNGRRSGKFASFLIADKTGILRVVLWNGKTSLIESGEIKVGQIVQISNGYTKESQRGKVELHISEKSKIGINPQDVEAKKYPTASKFTMKINEITQAYKNNKINVIGTVKSRFSISTFERQDSNVGKVARIMLADETGEIATVVWNEKVDELEENLKKGARLQILDAKVKKTLNEGLEIHVDSSTYMELLTPSEEFLKIAYLQPSSGIVSVEGHVVSKPTLREVKTSKEELVKLASFELMDETSRVWVSAWRKHAEVVKDFKRGDRIVIKDAYVKRGFSDQLEISTRESSTITVAS
jgi:replication factor A1